MTIPDWLRPGLHGALIGAVFVGGIGVSSLGWVTGGSARALADEVARDQIVAAFVPSCMGSSRTDTARVEKRATIEAAPKVERHDASMATERAILPGTDAPNADLARACLEDPNLDAS